MPIDTKEARRNILDYGGCSTAYGEMLCDEIDRLHALVNGDTLDAFEGLTKQIAAAVDHRDRLFDALNHAVDYIKEMPYYEGKLFCLWEAEAALKNIRLVAPT